MLVIDYISIMRSMTSQPVTSRWKRQSPPARYISRLIPLKFGRLFDGELRKIDNIPSRDFPRRVQRTRSSFSWRMLRSNDDMHRIIAHLIRRLLGFEIKRAETAVVASGNVK